jgi:hypothetical protein
MQKTIIEKICDDCHHKVVDFFLSINDKDFCKRCVEKRVRWSMKEQPVGKKCGFCDHGQVKLATGCHNDYVYETCEHCGGTGLHFSKELYQ